MSDRRMMWQEERNILQVFEMDKYSNIIVVKNYNQIYQSRIVCFQSLIFNCKTTSVDKKKKK